MSDLGPKVDIMTENFSLSYFGLISSSFFAKGLYILNEFREFASVYTVINDERNNMNMHATSLVKWGYSHRKLTKGLSLAVREAKI